MYDGRHVDDSVDICMMVKNEDDQGLQRWCIMLESRFHLIQFASGEESKVNDRIRQVAIPTPSEMYQTRCFLICDLLSC